MKKNIHPELVETPVTCSCGNAFTTLSVIWSEWIRVEICHKCHPFYTWEEKILKTWAVDKFLARQKKSEEMKK